MMKVQAFLVMLVQGSSGLRLIPEQPQLEKVFPEKPTILETLFTSHQDGKMALEHIVDHGVPSTLKVVRTSPDGKHEIAEVFLRPLPEEEKVMLVKNANETGKVVGDLPGGFHYKMYKGFGGDTGGVTNFLTALLKDLDQDKVTRFKKCGLRASGDPNARGGKGVWLVLNAEKLSPEQLEGNAAFQKNNVLVLGAPGKEVTGEKGRHFFVPFASLNFAAMSHTPMELVNRKAVEKDRALAYQHKNCKWNREKFFDQMCEGLAEANMTCYALGWCGHNKYSVQDNNNNKGGRNVKDRDDVSIQRYSRYMFAEAFENTAGIPSTPQYSSSGYITEKIIPALLSGAIPVYAGSDDVGEVFNTRALIQADPNNLKEAVNEMISLQQDSARYHEKQTVDAVSHEQMKKFFTWHPATWATYGDHLRSRIVDQILSFCETM